MTTQPTVDRATADALTQALFTPDDFGSVHAPWRDLIATPEFTYKTALSGQERISLAYRRMATINAQLAQPLALASDTIRLAGLHEWIAPADPTCVSALSIHHNLYLGSLIEADPHPLRPLDQEHRTGVFLASELCAGNDAAVLRTTATWNPDDGTFELTTPDHEAQKFMPNSSPAGGSKAGVVAARLQVRGVDHGVMLFHVPLTDKEGHPLPGIRIRQLPERTGPPLDHCLTSFDRVQLPAHALLEGAHGRLRKGEFTTCHSSPRAQFLGAIGRVTAGKLAMTASSIGCARAALAIAVRYAHHRYITGRPSPVPIAAHRTHSERLISRLAETFAATFLHRQALHAHALGTDEDRERMERNIALAKAWITHSARDTVTEARDRCGAQGVFPHNGIAGLAAALDATITAEGDNLPILVKAASEMLFDHETSPAHAPVASMNASLADLRHLLAEAQHIAADRAQKRFRSNDQTQLRGLDRWNQTSLPAVEAVTLHAAGQAADAFIAAINNCKDRQARALLAELAHVFLLRQIQPHTGSLLAHGCLTTHAVRSLPDALEESIAVLTPHMLTLTAAFQLDGYLTAIPIAHRTYASYYDDAEAPWNHRPDAQPGGAAPWSLAALLIAETAPADQRSDTGRPAA